MVVARRVFLAVVVCVVASCAPGTETVTPPIDPDGAGVPELLRFEYPLLDGGTLRGADLVGKDVAFWFWAPW